MKLRILHHAVWLKPCNTFQYAVYFTTLEHGRVLQGSNESPQYLPLLCYCMHKPTQGYPLFIVQSKEYTYMYPTENGHHSPVVLKKLTNPTAPRLICSVLHYLSICITAHRAGGERLGESTFFKTTGKYCNVRSH